ncbi:MAG: penicillin-binding protein activator LpoB [Pseudomonadota bacterium]
MMPKSMQKLFLMITLLSVFGILSGCTVSTRNVSPEEELNYDETYNFTDKKKIVKTLVESLSTKPPLGGATDRPIIIVYGIANRTSEHISTSGISDEIRKEILQTGKARFVNKEQRENIIAETDYQESGRVSQASRIKLAKQLGAKYMLTGTLRSIEKKESKQFRLTKSNYIYYSLNLELTDIETSLIEWADSVELVREASKPFIGW